MFVACPISVFLGLLPTQLNWRERTFLSWVRLRRAALRILATFPLLAGFPQTELIFNLVFFVVLTYVLMKGLRLLLSQIL